MKTPNYVLDRDISLQEGQDVRILEAGTFVRPIEFIYVPAHVKEKYRWASQKLDSFCYTFYGIVPIPKDAIRKT